MSDLNDYLVRSAAAISAMVERDLTGEMERAVSTVVTALSQGKALLICGNDGMAADNREYVDAMPDRFPMVSVTWVDGGHELDWERPELVAELTKRFLAGQL